MVFKRDGQTEPFRVEKIENAILKAFVEVDGEESKNAKNKAKEIASYINSLNKDMSVEEIQDIVESKLMASNRKDVAKAYIIYRNDRTRIREKNSTLMKNISKKLKATDVENQNANVDEKSFGGRIGAASSEVMKQYALDECMSKMARENHLNNEIYIHDLDSYAVGMHNCYDSSTKFVTQCGVKRFGDCSDGQIVWVIDKNGKWRKATVHKYGKQKMYDLVFKSGLTTKKVTCTRNHRWVLEDGTVTDNINVGDSLILTPNVTEEYITNNNLWCFGFVIGDGSDFYMRSKDKSRITNCSMQIRLCGHKVEYAKRFLECGWSIRQNHSNGDITLITRGNGNFKQSFLDNKFWKMMSYDDLCNIFEGYIHADGHFRENGSVMVSTSDIRVKQFIEDISSVCGYYIWSINEKFNDTNYKDGRMLYEFYLVKKQSTKWVLKSISVSRDGDGGYKTAWCIEEPVTNTFTLDGCMVTGNCLSIPFDKLLANGFNTRQTDVRPAQSVNTAGQLIAVIFQLQSLQQFGGVSATHIDWTLMPYVRKSFRKHYIVAYLKNTPEFIGIDLMGMLFDTYEDEIGVVRNRFDDWIDEHKKEFYEKTGLKEEDFYFDNKANLDPVFYQNAMYDTIIETKQAVEALYHNLNTLQSRSGNQLPFTSINYGTCTEPEGRMVIKSLLDVSIDGIGRLHKTSIFPCSIFQSMKGVNRKLGDLNYDLYRLALRSTAQRLYPNYANANWSGNEGYDPDDPRTFFSTMGCRTANGWDINGFGQLKDGRGNICPVTIIMPTLAMEAKERIDNLFPQDESIGYVEAFIKILDKKIHEARDMLIERYLWICRQSPDSAKFMYENYTMEGYDGKNIESAMKHGTLAIGQIGLAETLQILIGCDHTTKDGMKVAKRIEQLFKDRCAEFKKEFSLNFGVYYTPAENLCFTAMKKFKAKYGEIPNVSDKKFFTNSMHVPVWEEMSPFEKIDIESELTGYSSAGCITYVELESSVKNNIDALEQIVNYAMDHDIPYFAVNVPNDMCTNCGYTDEIGEECPICGCKKIRRLRRVTGYLTGDYIEAFNEGKQQEVDYRVKHFNDSLEEKIQKNESH